MSQYPCYSVLYGNVLPSNILRWPCLEEQHWRILHESCPMAIIESTHILTAPELTTGHRRIVVDTPLHQIIRQYLARGRAHDAEDPVRYADRHPSAPGSVAAWQRALRARQIYEGLRPGIAAFRPLVEVEIVPSWAFKTWLPQQGNGGGMGSGRAL